MAEEPRQFSKRKEQSGLEVRHRAGDSGKQEPKSPLAERMRNKEVDLLPRQRSSGSRRPVGDDAGPWTAGMIVLAGVAAIMVVVFAIWYTMIRNRAPVPVEPVVKRLDRTRVEASNFVSNSTPEEISEAIKHTVRSFMNAESLEERCQWVRGGQGMREKMEEFYSREGQSLPGRFGEITEWSRLAFGGVPVEVVTVKEEGDGKVHTFNILPGRDRMLIDWESAVAYGEMAWGELVEQRPVEPVQMRVFGKEDAYYNYEFADERKWQCFQVKTQAAEKTLFAYVERDSALGREVIGLLGLGNMVPMNVRLRFLPDAKGRDMVVIDELIHPFWIADEGLESSLEGEE